MPLDKAPGQLRLPVSGFTGRHDQRPPFNRLATRRTPPMRSVGAFEAQTHLAALLDAVAAGEQITITRHGRPVALRDDDGRP